MLGNRIGGWAFAVYAVLVFALYKIFEAEYFHLPGRLIVLEAYLIFAASVYMLTRYALEYIERESAVSALKAEPFQHMLQKVFMMLGFGDVAQHHFADFFRVNFVDEYHDEWHEQLARLKDDLRRKFVMRYPEGIKREEGVEAVVDDDAAVIDFMVDDARRVGGMENQRGGGYQYEYAGDRIAEYEGDGSQSQGDDADRPVPVGSFFHVEVLRCVP